MRNGSYMRGEIDRPAPFFLGHALIFDLVLYRCLYHYET